MNKLGFLLLAALASKGALASEVGAPFPQLANTTAILAVAIAETGASSSLAVEAKPEVVEEAAQYIPLHTYTENALEEMAVNFEQRVLQDLEARYAGR
jgi:predicted RNA methylase